MKISKDLANKAYALSSTYKTLSTAIRVNEGRTVATEFLAGKALGQFLDAVWDFVEQWDKEKGQRC